MIPELYFSQESLSSQSYQGVLLFACSLSGPIAHAVFWQLPNVSASIREGEGCYDSACFITQQLRHSPEK